MTPPTSAPSRIAVVGAGIIGLAVAARLAHVLPDARITVVDKENDIAGHQTGHNSGVVHAGLYYVPGSLKAQLCARGRELLRTYCVERGLPYMECDSPATSCRRSSRKRSVWRRCTRRGRRS